MIGIKKIYKLQFEECDPLQAIYSKENCFNKIIAPPKKLMDSLANFHPGLDEISLIVAKDTLKFRSYVEESKG
jgi:cell cycle checkpoint control protein RAD9A